MKEEERGQKRKKDRKAKEGRRDQKKAKTFRIRSVINTSQQRRNKTTREGDSTHTLTYLEFVDGDVFAQTTAHTQHSASANVDLLSIQSDTQEGQEKEQEQRIIKTNTTHKQQQQKEHKTERK